MSVIPSILNLSNANGSQNPVARADEWGVNTSGSSTGAKEGSRITRRSQGHSGHPLPTTGEGLRSNGREYYLISKQENRYWGPFGSSREALAEARCTPPMQDPMVVGPDQANSRVQ